jgi:rSAM/selenodomain-associated transferase 1
MTTTYPVLSPSGPTHIEPGTCALGVMVKAPRAGAVKTRLVPPLTPQEAAHLNVAFLRDTAANICSVQAKVKTRGVAIYTPVGAESDFDGLLPDEFCMIAQRGGDFGERLYNSAADLLEVGFESVCLIDSDSPTLPNRFLTEAADRLSAPDDRVVLGQAIDGGYYLIGIKSNHRALFTDIDWSTDRVLSQTLAKAASSHLPTELLPPWYDVDDAASLVHLCDELLAPTAQKKTSSSGGVHYPAPFTRRFLANLVERESLRFPGASNRSTSQSV